MTTFNHDIDSYQVYLHAGPGGGANVAGARGSIFLALSGQDGNGRAYLQFFPGRNPLPDNSVDPAAVAGPDYYLNYRYPQMDTAVDLLRNESGRKLAFDDVSLEAQIWST